MSLLNNKDMREFLRVSRTGFWEIQVKDGEKTRFFADTVMNELLGTEESMTPEERFAFHRAHVHEDDMEMLKEKPCGYYDLILMDIQMPKMNGYEAAEKIRAWEDEQSQIPIVAMTANAFEEDKRAAFAAGMNGHVGKPVEITKLMQILSEIIK